MKELESEVDQLLASCEISGPLTMARIEDLVLAACQGVTA
jgi:hypothetical protein